MRRLSVLLTSLTLGLLAVEGAWAKTYCVNAPAGSTDAACTDTAASLPAALTSAAGSAGSDSIRLHPGTYTAGTSGFSYSSADPVTLTGVGSGEVILTATSLGDNAVLTLTGADHAVSDVTVRLPATVGGNSYGMFLSGGTDATRVKVDEASASGSGGFWGIYAGSGSILTEVSVALTRTGYNAGVNLQAATLLDSDVATAAGSALLFQEASTAKRSILIGPTGVLANYTTGRIEGSLIRATSATGVGIHAVSDTTDLDVDGSTIVGSGGTSRGLLVDSFANAAVRLDVFSSIVSGFGTAMRAQTDNSGSAVLSGNWTLFTFGSESASGTGAVQTCANGCANDAATGGPRFISATDFRLKPNSPGIDAADPGDPGASVFDLTGGLRAIDGDGRNGVRRDHGAYEMPVPAAPTVSASVPAQVAPGEAVAFTASGADASPGDELTYSWTFADGSTASGATVQKTFATTGQQSGTVVVTDLTGRTGTASATVTVAAPRSPQPTQQEPSGTGLPADQTRPVLSTLKLTPRAFRLGTLAPAVVAAKKQRKPKATRISFVLTEAASVRYAFERLTKGVRSGGRCAAGTPKKGRKRCTISSPVGAFLLAGAAGANRVRFAGVIDAATRLVRGRYRLTATATDAAGNVSEPRSVTFRIVNS